MENTVNILTDKVVDSLGTRYHVTYLRDNGMDTRRTNLGTFTDSDKAKEMAFNAYTGAVEEYGMNNVYVTEK